MTPPTSLDQALTASKLARAAEQAWRLAYYGKPLPVALADALRTLVHLGDQATAAGVTDQVRRTVTSVART